MNRRLDLDLTDERLREWAHFFRDRRRLERCKSIEHRFRAQSEDFAVEGWGDMDATPSVRPARSYSVLRAVQTQESIDALDRIYKWALTYAYCYPSLPRFVVLRCMRKFTGRRLNWGKYEEVCEIARIRLHTTASGWSQRSAAI
jgi:hypothetical protein